jgi:hypothetical protein
MIKVYSPQNEVDLSIIRSFLEGEPIPCFIHNDHFGSLRIGPVIELYNAKTLMVNEEDYDRAKELISDYLNNTRYDQKEFTTEYSLFDKIRVIVEVIIFGWIMPGTRKNWKNLAEE